MVRLGLPGQGLQDCSFSLLWAATSLSLSLSLSLSPPSLSLSRKKKAKQFRNRCAQSPVQKNCSRSNVEPVGKTSVALDTVFRLDLEKE